MMRITTMEIVGCDVVGSVTRDRTPIHSSRGDVDSFHVVADVPLSHVRPGSVRYSRTRRVRAPRHFDRHESYGDI
jgi:hypothetical protein